MIRGHYTKTGARWTMTGTEEKTVTREFYNNFTDKKAVAFMRALGGTERVTKAYTYAGFVPVKITSISPDGAEKIVTKFIFTL